MNVSLTKNYLNIKIMFPVLSVGNKKRAYEALLKML